MITVIVVGIGGFLGATARYLLSTWIQHRFPSQLTLGTLVVNVCGCFVLGVIMALISQHELFGNKTRIFLLAGLIGSFTTFSAVAYEAFHFLQNRELIAAFSTLLLNLILGIITIVIAQWAIRLLSTN